MTATADPVPLARSRGVSPVLLWITVGLVVAGIVASVVAGVPATRTILFGGSMVAMVVAGVVVGRDGARAGLGALMLCVAAAGSLSDLASDVPAGPFPVAAILLYWPYVALFAHLLLRWPDPRVDGMVGRGLLIAAYGLMPLLSLLWVVTWSTEFYDFDASSWWWPAVAPDEGFSTAVYDGQQALYAVLLVVLVAVVIVRTAGATGARRAAMWPVTAAAVLLVALVALGVLQRFGVASGADLTTGQDVAVLAVPVGILVGRWLASAAVRRAA